MDNYFTKQELQQTINLITVLNGQLHDEGNGINVEAKIFDANGLTVLGRVAVTDGGEYGLYPGEF